MFEFFFLTSQIDANEENKLTQVSEKLKGVRNTSIGIPEWIENKLFLNFDDDVL